MHAGDCACAKLHVHSACTTKNTHMDSTEERSSQPQPYLKDTVLLQLRRRIRLAGEPLEQVGIFALQQCLQLRQLRPLQMRQVLFRPEAHYQVQLQEAALLGSVHHALHLHSQGDRRSCARRLAVSLCNDCCAVITLDTKRCTSLHLVAELAAVMSLLGNPQSSTGAPSFNSHRRRYLSQVWAWVSLCCCL